MRISRPRFWIYEAGPLALGILAGAQFLADAFTPATLAYALFFLFPANLYIYGINDIYDYETDKLNPRKTEGYEALVLPEERPALWKWIILSSMPFALGAFFLPLPAALSLIAFFFCAGFYSAPPIRAKARPVLDSLFSAGHYVATGVFGFYLAGGSGFPLAGILAGMAWSTAMHAYSAAPDIAADKAAGLATIATALGRMKTLILCLALYLVSAYLSYPALGAVSLVLGVVYAGLMLRTMLAKDNTEELSLYAYFPPVNTLAGMAVFFAMLLARI